MRRAASLACVLACAALLSGCARGDPLVDGRVTVLPPGKWRVDTAHDRITNAPVSSAYVMTREVSHSGAAMPRPAVMQLRCFKNEPIVRFAFGNKIGSTRNAQFGYAVDRHPGHQPAVRFVDGYTSAVIEDRDEVARFVGQLGAAKSVYIRIMALNAGRTSAEFETDGAAAAIAAAYATCPLAQPQPGKPQAGKPQAAKPASVARAAEPDPEDNEDAATPAFQTEEEQAARQVMGWFGR